jgi:hypothetical protein
LSHIRETGDVRMTTTEDHDIRRPPRREGVVAHGSVNSATSAPVVVVYRGLPITTAAAVWSAGIALVAENDHLEGWVRDPLARTSEHFPPTRSNSLRPGRLAADRVQFLGTPTVDDGGAGSPKAPSAPAKTEGSDS